MGKGSGGSGTTRGDLRRNARRERLRAVLPRGGGQDYTRHKTDEADCVMIARLAVELHCYLPGQLDEAWAHLRHLGRRREQLITSATASANRIRDFLSVAWPTVTETCAGPLASRTWLAAVQLAAGQRDGQPGALAAMGEQAFIALVRDGELVGHLRVGPPGAHGLGVARALSG